MVNIFNNSQKLQYVCLLFIAYNIYYHPHVRAEILLAFENHLNASFH